MKMSRRRASKYMVSKTLLIYFNAQVINYGIKITNNSLRKRRKFQQKMFKRQKKKI